MLAVALRPPRKINRRQSVDISNMQRLQPSMVQQRRRSFSTMPASGTPHQTASRAEILQQLQMPSLLQLDEAMQNEDDIVSDTSDEIHVVNNDVTEHNNQADDALTNDSDQLSMEALHVDDDISSLDSFVVGYFF